MIYTQLTPEQKAKAIEKVRQEYEYAWLEESRNSIRTFMEHFGVTLRNWQVDAYNFSYDPQTPNVRNKKLKDFDPEYMPTGYCLDCDLWGTFHKVFKETGDAKRAYKEALHAGFKAWSEDLSGQLEDEYLEDYIIANEFNFVTEKGIQL